MLQSGTNFCQLPKLKIEKCQCSSEREFYELIKTHLPFIHSAIFVVVIHSYGYLKNRGLFWDTLYAFFFLHL